MPVIWCILIDLLLLWFFCGNWLLETFLPKPLLRKRRLKNAAKALRQRLRRDGDLLSAHDCAAIAECRRNLLDACQDGDAGRQEKALKTYSGMHLPAFRHHGVIGTNLEMLLVACGVAFGIRALFVNPFKIPTGSMQPTLFGVHFVELSEEEIPHSRLAAVFDCLNYSRRYFQLQAPAEGMPDFQGIRPLSRKPFFPTSAVPFVSESGICKGTLVVPANVVNTQKLLYDYFLDKVSERRPEEFYAQEGDILLQGAMESGDQLFVNRLSLCFHEPSRGDIMVFSTEGLSYKGQPLAGLFYVKRLVGLPGDTLKIVDRVLYVKPKDASEFLPLDGSYSRPFARIQSRKDGYAGHSVQPRGAYLTQDGEEFTLPDEMYFLMGDNTDNSLDCRFFGPVARKNLVGTPCFVWWPFSTRFGFRFDKR